ncbi:hypothetical protein K4F52_009081 [Lecanicillium sp. MT-2017a]|nr:hypothetical protein K4F52_009081 [Lecanicillium sp. MT-2017a]
MEPGSWTDHGSMNIPVPPLELSSDGSYRPPYVRLDGNLLVDSFDPQGTSMVKYMVFGSYQFGLYGVALSDDLLTMKPGSVPYLIIADQYQRPSEPGQFDQSGNYTEGPYQLAHGDWLYIFYSRGNCCAPGSFDISTVYQTQVCRTPIGNGPAGPYVDRNGESCSRGSYYRHGSIFLYSNNEDGNRATVFAPGSVGVINDPDEGLCMWYQYQDNTAELPNLRFGYNYLNFDADGWPILTAER